MKTAIVCGATQGIGYHCAVELAKMGNRIILMARNTEKLSKITQEMNGINGLENTFLVADFSKPSIVETTIKNWVNKGNTAQILINNTGGPKGGAISSAPVSEFLDAFNQHLICNHILATALIPGMKKESFGRIVNIISTSVKQPLPNLGVSNTIRGAVANWSKTLASELGQYNITVNNVLPGATMTSRLQILAQTKADALGIGVDDVFQEMASESPMKRLAQPEEIAAAVAFLSSNGASYINGINLPVDGGRTKSL
jgi:3-oxoacyl-[acyl-carrier protein] reductase